MPADSTLRASDAEREHVVSALGEHLADGRLDFSEFEDRVASAYAARTRGELEKLTADLPPPAAQAPRTVGRPRGTFSTALTADRVRPFANWLVTGIICLVIWAATSLAEGRPLYFWPGWVIGPWGAMLFMRTRSGTAWGPCHGRRNIQR